MKKYSRELINRYINSEDITIYDIDELENDKDFMMQVISVSGDNNFYNLCSDNVKCDYDYSVLYEPTKSLQEDFSKIIDDINLKENDLKDEKILKIYIKYMSYLCK